MRWLRKYYQAQREAQHEEGRRDQEKPPVVREHRGEACQSEERQSGKQPDHASALALMLCEHHLFHLSTASPTPGLAAATPRPRGSGGTTHAGLLSNETSFHPPWVSPGGMKAGSPSGDEWLPALPVFCLSDRMGRDGATLRH